MRADLLEAQACVDWAASKLPDLGARIDAWLRDNVYVAVEDIPPPATHNPVVMVEKEFLPLAFNVDVGAYLNTFRSSLDILAVAVAQRHGITRLHQVYFPVAKSLSDFTAPTSNVKWKYFVDGLPNTEHTILETIKPYAGGNDLLWLLHQLDIKRKHQRLLDVILRPIMFKAPADFPTDAFTPNFTSWISANDKTVLGLLRKDIDGARYELEVTPLVTLNEPGILQHMPVVKALHDFACLAHSIIELFDY